MIPAASVVRREQAALVVIDIQDRLAAAMGRQAQVIDRTALLVRVAGIVGMPVLFTRQYPKGLGDTVAPLLEVSDEQVQLGHPVTVVDKLTFDCFGDERFTHAIASSTRQQLVVCGMESHICVTQTALSGLREGFDVHVVGDACCSQSDEAHDIALCRMRHAGAVVTTAESVAYELVGMAGTPEFKELLGVVKRASQTQ